MLPKVVLHSLAVLCLCHLVSPGPDVSRPHRTINDILTSMRQSRERLTNLVTEQKSRWAGIPDTWSVFRHSLSTDDLSDAEMMMLEDPLLFMAEQPYINVKKNNPAHEFKISSDNENLQLIAMADRNIQKVLREGQCLEPTKKCVRVSREGKIFMPSCALVHHCGEHSGCCRSQDHVCSPIAQEPIELYFMYLKMSKDMEKRKLGIDSIKFMNHTQCGCRKKTVSHQHFDLPIRDYPNTSRKPKLQAAAKPKRCYCAKYYTPVLQDAQCLCECSKSIPKCFKYSKGRRTFSTADAQCIVGGDCSQPDCMYGGYNMTSARCPKKQRAPRRKKHAKRLSYHFKKSRAD